MKNIRIEKSTSIKRIIIISIGFLFILFNAFDLFISELPKIYINTIRLLMIILFLYYTLSKFVFAPVLYLDKKYFIINVSRLNIKQVYFKDIMSLSYKDNYIGLKKYNGNVEMINVENLKQEDINKILDIINQNSTIKA